MEESLARSLLDFAYTGLSASRRGHAAKEVSHGGYGRPIPARWLLLQPFYLLLDISPSRLRNLSPDLSHGVDASLRLLRNRILCLARVVIILAPEKDYWQLRPLVFAHVGCLDQYVLDNSDR